MLQSRRCGLRWPAMEWFESNWPVILLVLALFIITAGLMRKVAKLAFLGAAIGVFALVLWPMVSGSISL